MSKSLASLSVRIGANISDFQSKMKQAQKNLEHTGKKFEQMGKSLSMYVTAPLMAAGAAAAINADKQIRAEGMLSTALKSTGEHTKEALSGFKKYAAELQKLTNVGDEVSLELMAMGKNMNAVDTKGAVRDAIALSKVYDVDLKSALRAVVGAQQGNFKALQRYAPSLKMLGTNSEKAAETQRLLADSFELAKEKAQLGLGPFEALKNSIGDASEGFGAIILDAIQPLAKSLTSVFEKVSELPKPMKNTIVAIGGITAAIGPLTLGVGAFVGKVLPMLLTGFVAIKAAFLSLSAVIMANPIGALLTVLAAAAAAFMIFRKRTDDAAQAQWKLGDAVTETTKAIGEQIWNSLAIGAKLSANGILELSGSVENLRNKLSSLTREELQSLKLYLEDQLANAMRNAKNETNDLMAELARQDVANFERALLAVTGELGKFTAGVRNVTESIGIISQLNEQMKQLKEAKEIAQTTQEIGNLNDQIKLLEERLQNLDKLSGRNIAPLPSMSSKGAPTEISADGLNIPAPSNDIFTRMQQGFEGLFKINLQYSESLANIVGLIGNGMTTAFDDALSGSKSFFDSFGQMIVKMLKQLASAVASALVLAVIFTAVTGGSGGALKLLGMSGGGFLAWPPVALCPPAFQTTAIRLF